VGSCELRRRGVDYHRKITKEIEGRGSEMIRVSSDSGKQLLLASFSGFFLLLCV
jgi:hypothetical protein